MLHLIPIFSSNGLKGLRKEFHDIRKSDDIVELTWVLENLIKKLKYPDVGYELDAAMIYDIRTDLRAGYEMARLDWKVDVPNTASIVEEMVDELTEYIDEAVVRGKDNSNATK
jgi:hypothetical protein